MKARTTPLVLLAVMAAAIPGMCDAQTIVKVFAAGNLRASLTEIAQAFKTEMPSSLDRESR